MVKKLLILTLLTCVAVVFTGLETVAFVQSVLTASGPNGASIQSVVDLFRGRLDELRPNDPVSFPDRRREINWDAVPETFLVTEPISWRFLQLQRRAPRARGNVFDNPDTGQFQVSANPDNPNRIPPRFGNIHYTYPDIFAAFSPEKIFTPIGSRTTDVHFFLPSDQTTPASVAGFGAVFTSGPADRRMLLAVTGL